MIDFDNQTQQAVAGEIFTDVYAKLTDKDLELIIVDDETIRELNKEHRELDKATDVLSFPIDDPNGRFLGSVVISIDTAQRVAKELGHDEKLELRLLFLHGVLHLLGFDHETDTGEMRQKEHEMALLLGLPESMLVRSEDK